LAESSKEGYDLKRAVLPMMMMMMMNDVAHQATGQSAINWAVLMGHKHGVHLKHKLASDSSYVYSRKIRISWDVTPCNLIRTPQR
jgi:hypothetical protein